MLFFEVEHTDVTVYHLRFYPTDQTETVVTDSLSFSWTGNITATAHTQIPRCFTFHTTFMVHACQLRSLFEVPKLDLLVQAAYSVPVWGIHIEPANTLY